MELLSAPVFKPIDLDNRHLKLRQFRERSPRNILELKYDNSIKDYYKHCNFRGFQQSVSQRAKNVLVNLFMPGFTNQHHSQIKDQLGSIARFPVVE